MNTPRIQLRSLTLILLFVVAGCQATGAGFGTMRNGATTSIAFEWRGTDSVSGTMTATFADGRTFSGKYFQITSETRLDFIEPLWIGWSPRWRGWRHWEPMPGPQFVKHYSGRVLANLGSPDGERMRCRFRLVHPSSGMSGGGQGDYQLADGKTIDAVFPAA